MYKLYNCLELSPDPKYGQGLTLNATLRYPIIQLKGDDVLPSGRTCLIRVTDHGMAYPCALNRSTKWHLPSSAPMQGVLAIQSISDDTDHWHDARKTGLAEQPAGQSVPYALKRTGAGVKKEEGRRWEE